MKNILSIDLESWIHHYIDAVKPEIKISSHEKKNLDDLYINHATVNILNLLEKHDQKATFFVVGEIFEWDPEIIEEIEKRGHEIGYHSHNHNIITNAEMLEDELKQSHDFIKRFNPIGYRAPFIHITRDCMACLKHWGFKYSSSTYSAYSMTRINGVYEIPVSSISLWKKQENDSRMPKPLNLKSFFTSIPFGSGIFFAILGSKIGYFINYLNNRNIPAIIFIHPWQLYKIDEISRFSFYLKVLFRNFLCTPYTINVLKNVEILFKRHHFVSFKDFYKF
tara:strand:+ start:1079 stop:1915 length:837 start_codon:yes stop_codon:yes gene_type:complete